MLRPNSPFLEDDIRYALEVAGGSDTWGSDVRDAAEYATRACLRAGGTMEDAITVAEYAASNARKGIFPY